MDELLMKAMEKIKIGEIRVILEDFDNNLYGFILENNNHIAVFLNSKQTYEKQRENFLHEIKHLEHLLTYKEIELCEEEAKTYCKDIFKNIEVLK